MNNITYHRVFNTVLYHVCQYLYLSSNTFRCHNGNQYRDFTTILLVTILHLIPLVNINTLATIMSANIDSYHD